MVVSLKWGPGKTHSASECEELVSGVTVRRNGTLNNCDTHFGQRTFAGKGTG